MRLGRTLATCFVESLTDAAGLRAFRFGLRVIDVLKCQVQLELVMLTSAAIFCSSIGENA